MKLYKNIHVSSHGRHSIYITMLTPDREIVKYKFQRSGHSKPYLKQVLIIRDEVISVIFWN